jgi:hypothetical protein
MEFIVEIPESYPNERDYILSVMLKDFLGLDFIIERSGKAEVCICEKDRKKRVIIPDSLFAIPRGKWRTQESLPKVPLKILEPRTMDISNISGLPPLPVIYGCRKADLDATNRQRDIQSLILPIDIFGSCFFMLSRYEEVVLPDRDNLDRFPGNASLAYKEGFLYRPIVDEYLELLWACMKSLWPELERKSREGEVFVTCDVDCPYDDSLSSPTKAMRRVAGDIFKRLSVDMALRSARIAIGRFRGDWALDPYNTFDWMMDTCEKASKRIAFYFLCQKPSDLDARYDLGETFIKQLLRRIHLRQHEIGVHGSYNTYQNLDQIKKERSALLQACESQGIDKAGRGNRQHFLRWDTSQTPDHLNAAGFEYDTTGSFADLSGFRYGTSRPFTMWGWQKNGSLRIKECPLVVMEDSVMDDCYMGLGRNADALDLMQLLKERAMQLGGDFTFLWHNSSLITPKDRESFKVLIS